MELISSGVTDYVRIRQQVGLTSAELDDIIENREYYSEYFRKQTPVVEPPKKKHWWQK
jgi:hypothetical protein